MFRVRSFLLLLIAAGFMVQCNFSHRKAEQAYEYVPLKEYNYNPASIQPGTEVELIAFSGGKPNDKDDIYYYQFIVVVISTHDTLRILTPLISFDETEAGKNKTYTTPLQFDPSKGITNAFYELKDSTQNLLLQVPNLVKGDSSDTSPADIQSLMSHINAKEFVVVNKSMPIFENPAYQTAIGILNFKKMPW